MQENRVIRDAVVFEDFIQLRPDRTVALLVFLFDPSINRVAAWIIGIRATQKALLLALLEPLTRLREAETSGNFTARLALLEEAKSLPWGAVWDEFCQRNNVPAGAAWLAEVEAYGQETARIRS